MFHLGTTALCVQGASTSAVVNEVMRFVVQAADQFGNVLTTDNFAAMLDSPVVSPAGPAVSLVQVAPGKGQITFLASSLGTHSIGIQLGGSHVQGSPLAVEVVASLVANLAHTLTDGALIEGVNMWCSRPQHS
jgi:hypothetical protein